CPPTGERAGGGFAGGAVTAGDRHGARGHDEPRAGDDAVVDGALDVDVGVPSPLGLEVAHGGEAVLEADLHGPAGAQGTVRGRLLEDLFVVVLGRHVAL